MDIFAGLLVNILNNVRTAVRIDIISLIMFISLLFLLNQQNFTECMDGLFLKIAEWCIKYGAIKTTKKLLQSSK